MKTPKTKFLKVKLEFLVEFDEEIDRVPEGFSATRAVRDGFIKDAHQTVKLHFPKVKK